MDVKTLLGILVALVAGIGGPLAAVYGVRQTRRMNDLQTAVEAALKTRQEDRADREEEVSNSDYWEMQTLKMRGEVELLAAKVKLLEEENARQTNEIGRLKAQIFDLQNDRQRQTSEGRRQTEEGDRQTREGERQTYVGREQRKEGDRLRDMKKEMEDDQS